jgi:flagellar hook-length control protein FliK
MSTAATGGLTVGSALIAKSDPGTLQPSQPSLPTDVSQSADAAAKRPATAPAPASSGESDPAIAVQVEPQSTGESATQGLQHAAGHAKSGKDFQTAASDAGTASSAATAPGEKAEAMKWMAALEQAKVPLATKAVEPTFAPLMIKAERSTGERAASAFKTTEPGYSGTALGVSAPDYSQSGAAVPITAPEMQVAEQVTYWVSQNVQNAELKLDGLGQSPVEVSISVQGKEAQITFRTDEASTRGVLEGASAHLKDMLQREGMVLTGVSVGTSGSGDSSGAERRARQAARQGVIPPLQVATVPTQDIGRRVGSVAGRSVDLFV